MVASRAKAKELGLPVVAKIRSWATASVEPADFGIAPVPATKKALDRAGLTIQDMGVVEINEAFAAQTLACMQDLGLEADRVNLRGGAIAWATWGRELGSCLLMEIMKETGTPLGVATICGNGGNAGAMVLEGE